MLGLIGSVISIIPWLYRLITGTASPVTQTKAVVKTETAMAQAVANTPNQAQAVAELESGNA